MSGAPYLKRENRKFVNSSVSVTDSFGNAFSNKFRKILDGILIVNEIVDKARRKKKELLMFKVDFEKAYDSVEWSFLDYMMSKMGFHEKWRRWIAECLKSTAVSILINGNPTNEFMMERGLRQGDPLSPFLFLIVVEGFNMLIKKALDCSKFIGYKFEKGTDRFTHLQYADDTLIIGEKKWINIRIIKANLLFFEAVRPKSSFQQELDCLPIGANPTWQLVIEAVRGRLLRWRSCYISFGGHLVLIKSDLLSLVLQGSDRHGLWLKALKNRYGEIEVMRGIASRKDSNWWKKLCDLEIGEWGNSSYFSIKEMYKDFTISGRIHSVLTWTKIWHKAVPTKISCFGWRLFHNSLATKNNLYRRNVIGQGSTRCIGECSADESISHLFFECPFFSGIWQFICKWLRISTALHRESMAHFTQFEGLIGGDKEISSKACVIWYACVWSIWKARNAKIFRNIEVEIVKLIEDIIECSWRWLSSINGNVQVNYAQWRINLRPCLGLDF
ncbi:uncharacterized protein LOC131649093 [Vicia villosa]|uniref:uncharacterized protein LOC131649093 n=1 Tax=Vicia villosa TaxID=3911 RepID=UPI00273AD2D5|nr:uncharacterized protein LOC131649093 [Vicia villosa]